MNTGIALMTTASAGHAVPVSSRHATRAFRAAVEIIGGAAAMILAAGCGSEAKGPATVPVAGVVTMDGGPADLATVSFMPIDGTPGGGAAAATDAAGAYVLRSARQEEGVLGRRVVMTEGVPAGRYKVWVSRRLHADGTPMRPEEAPIESQAMETIARPFSDESATPLIVEVPAGGGTFDLEVKGVRR